MKYDYIVVGRWRNRDNIAPFVAKLRGAGKSVYCFLDNEYDSDGITFSKDPHTDVEAMMATTEKMSDWQTNPTFRKIFENDMNGLRDSKKLVIVFPSGLAAHMELGAAYGMGKKCYAIGEPEKPETLYLMLDRLFPDTETFLKELP
ncbi:MAG TPA: hypothetical protein VIM53_01515 [Candidatus Saccharimonadales bacterium]